MKPAFKILFFLILTVALHASDKKFNLLRGKWICKIGEIADTLVLHKNGSFIYYYCEIEERSFGTYTFKKDTLYLVEKRGQYDNERDSEHPRPRGTMKFILSSDDRLISPSDKEYIFYRISNK